MKNLRIVIKITCKVIFYRSLKFILYRNWILISFLKIKLILIWLSFSLLGKICKIRTYFIECIIVFVLFLIIFPKIVSSCKLWCLRFSFNLFIFNRNKLLILDEIWLYNMIRIIYHTVYIIFEYINIWFILNDFTRFYNYLMVYFCKSFIFFVISSIFTWFIKSSLISRGTILNCCLTKNRINSPIYLIIILILHKFLNFKICI